MAKEYIERKAALAFPFANGRYDHEHANEHFIFGCESYKEWLEQLPAADVVARDCYNRLLAENDELRKERPVRHGWWIWNPDGMDWGLGAWCCSECGSKAETWWANDSRYNPLHCSGGHFCGNCGALMDKDGDGE